MASTLSTTPDTYVNYEAERRLLAVLIKHNKTLPQVMARAKSEWFHDTSHRNLYEALCDVYRDHGVLSATRIYGKLRGDTHSQTLMKALEADYARPEEAPPLLEALHLCHRRRTWYDVAEQISRLSASTDLNDDVYLDTEVQAAVYNAMQNQSASEAVKLSDGVRDVIQQMEDAKEGRVIPRLKVGFNAVDGLTNGLTPGEFIILAGAPGMGKSAYALSVGLNVAKAGGGVLYFSPEMSLHALARRSIQVEGPVGNAAFGETPSEEHIRRAKQVYGELKDRPFYVMDHRGITVERIAAVTRAMHLQNPLRLLIIDHFGEISKPRGFHAGGNTALMLGDMMLQLATLGRQLGIPILLLHQLNKVADDKRIRDKRPTPGDLRDTGRAREIADQIWLLYRHSKYADVEDNHPFGGVAELIVGKNRNGQEGTAYLWFDDQFTRYREFDEKFVGRYKAWANGTKEGDAA